MGTKKTTQTTNQYDPTSMGAFQKGTPAWSNQAINFAQNPYGNPQFQFESQMGTRNAMQQNQTGVKSLLQNMLGSGMAGGASNPAATEMLQNQARAGTANTALQGFINPTALANQRQQQSMGLLQGYKPLQTGQNQTESTSGLGTWLPQVAGMGLGALTGGMGGAGMLGGLFGGLMGHGGGGGGYGAGLLAGSGMSPQGSFWQGNGSSGYASYPGQLQDPSASPWFR